MRRGLLAVLVSLLLVPGSVFAFQFNAPPVFSHAFTQISGFIDTLFAPPIAAHPNASTASAASAAASENNPSIAPASSSSPIATPSPAPVTSPPAEPTTPTERTVYLQPQTIERTVLQSAPLPNDPVHTSLLAELLATFEAQITDKLAAITSPKPFPEAVAAGGHGVLSYGAASAASSGGSGSGGVSLSDVNVIVAAAVQAALSAIDHLTANTITATNASTTNLYAQNLAAGNAAVSGDAQVGGNLTVNGTISGGTLAVAGLSSDNAVVAPYFTATSSATSSFAGDLSVTGFVNTLSGYEQGGSLLLYASSTNFTTGLGIGAGAGFNATSTPIYSTALGYGALGNAPQDANTVQNTAIGFKTLNVNTYGYNNTAVGSSALRANTTGIKNTANGWWSLRNNTTGNYNTASGLASLQNNITGSFNTAFGMSSLQNGSAGNNNTALGFQSLYNTTGSSSVAIGFTAGYTNAAGNYNTYIGAGADSAFGNLSNATAIGYNAIVGASNALVLGGTGAYGVNVGIATTTPWGRLSIDTSNLPAGVPEFTIGSSTRQDFIVTQNGNVGIGTTSPSTQLEISGTLPMLTLSGYPANNGSYIRNRDNLGYLSIQGGADWNTGATMWLVGNSYSSPASDAGSVQFSLGTTNSNYDFSTANGSSFLMRILGNGNVGIATTTPWARLSLDTSNLPAGEPEFTIGSSTRQDFIVTQNGNVGIGTTSPGTTLEISGNYVTGKGSLYINPSAGQHGYLSINADENKEAGVQLRDNGATVWWLYRTAGLTDNLLLSSAEGDKLAVTQSGNVGIGTTSPDTLLTVGSNVPSGSVAHFENSTGSCYINPTTTSLSCSSDARLKTNVVPLDSAGGLAAVLKLNPVTYNWKTEGATSSPHTGFIAQDVQSILPDLVSQGPDGYYTLDYAGFTPYLVKAVQEIATISGAFKTNLIAWLGSASNGLTNLFATTFHGHLALFDETDTGKLCINSGTNQTCITQQQLAAILSQSAASTLPTSVTSSSGSQVTNSGNPGNANSTPPVITINGENPATITVGSTYADLGATITAPQADVNLSLTVVVDNATSTDGSVQIDTSTPGTHTILYTVTDPSGLTGSATRTVIVSTPQPTPPPANDNTTPVANDTPTSGTIPMVSGQ